MSSFPPDATVIVEKTMTLSADEFWKSIAALRDQACGEARELPLPIGCGSGRAEIGFLALPPARLGGLALPRAKVTIAFHGVDGDERRRFLGRFDIAFQRGGG
jgi:hypothetical protein